MSVATFDPEDFDKFGDEVASAANDDGAEPMRTPPHDLLAERAVVASTAYGSFAEGVAPEDFFSEQHRRVFEAALSLKSEGAPTEPSAILIRLKSTGRLAQCGGVEEVTRLLTESPVGQIEYYGAIVKRHAKARRALFFWQRLQAQTLAGLDPDALVQSAVAELTEIERVSKTTTGVQPDPADPLRGLVHLAKVAVVGRAQIAELADRPITWVWDYIATSGLIVLLAAGPGCGKTTLLFLLIVARANRGAPVKVLGYTMAPSPGDTFIVVVENEHSDESAARILRKSCALLGVEETALERVILIARGNVRIGSPAWGDIETLISAGLVSDIVLDTLARTAPSDANDEREQVEVFSRIADAIELAPSPDKRPMCWTAAHTRKHEGVPTLDDVGGSTQRAGQADVVLLMSAQRAADKLSSVKLVFGKVREKDAEDWPEPVEYVVKKSGVVVVDAPEQDDRPIETRITEHLELFGPTTASQLSEKLGRSRGDIQLAITTLFQARAITSVEVKIRGGKAGGTAKAFDLRKDG